MARLYATNVMKNVYVLPTEKQSRFYSTARTSTKKRGYAFGEHYIPNTRNMFSNHNIYITNDEYIGLSYYLDGNLVRKGVVDDKDYWKVRKDYKKIILTTDQDLIKDGVQAIDDEFLEWFVKNPSCDEIMLWRFHGINTSIAEVNTISGDGSLNWQGKDDLRDYKIIIPKEEPSSQSLVGRKLRGFKFEEKPELHWWRGEMEKYIGVIGIITGVSMDNVDVVVRFPNDDKPYRYPFELINEHLEPIIPSEEPKQESLEEVAEKLTNDFPALEVRFNMTNEEIHGWFLEALQKGAKWQAERMYSEEDMKEAFGVGINVGVSDAENLYYLTFEEWFEQFKNK